jgi:hypothetical protein
MNELMVPRWAGIEVAEDSFYDQAWADGIENT